MKTDLQNRHYYHNELPLKISQKKRGTNQKDKHNNFTPGKYAHRFTLTTSVIS
jgi:hypothetical protein